MHIQLCSFFYIVQRLIVLALIILECLWLDYGRLGQKKNNCVMQEKKREIFMLIMHIMSENTQENLLPISILI